MTWNGNEIATEQLYRDEWSAWLKGQEDLGMRIGRGPTRGDAITDLLESLL